MTPVSLAAPCTQKLFVVLVTESGSPLCDPTDCSPPGSSVHGIPQARRVEWVAISFSRGSSQPRGQTQVSSITGRFFTTKPPGRHRGGMLLFFLLVICLLLWKSRVKIVLSFHTHAMEYYSSVVRNEPPNLEKHG